MGRLRLIVSLQGDGRGARLTDTSHAPQMYQNGRRFPHLHKRAAFIYLAVTGRRVPRLVQAALNICLRRPRPPVVITHNTKMRRVTVNSSQASQSPFGTGVIFVAGKHFRRQ